jgi:hypothetical protein
MADRIRKPDEDYDLRSPARDYAEVREAAVPYGHHSLGYEVVLAGLGAKARAREKGDDFFRKLVEKGRELGAVPSADPALADASRDILAYADALDHLARERRAFSRMVEAMLPETPLPSSPTVLQARRNAEWRLALITEFGLLSSTDIAELAGSQAKNKASLAHRWKQEGRIFSVPYQGAELFPAYQFDKNGRPLPVIARVLASLGRQSRSWELALWFLGANGWLDNDKRPVDLLWSAPDEVAQVAEREAEGLFF